MRLRPTLLLGVGEGGVEVCLHLIRRLKQAGWAPPICRFLLVDRPPLEPRLEALRGQEGPRVTVEWQEVPFSPSPPRRPLGEEGAPYALPFYERLRRIYAQITDLPLLQRLEAQGHRLDTHNADVFLVAALDDGVGSSCFLDVAFLVRASLQDLALDERLHGFLLLPPAFETSPERDARAYAALKELDFLMERSSFSRAYGPALEVRVARRPFDTCFLFDATNERGQSLAAREDLHRLLAEILFVWLTSPLGEALEATLLPLRVPPRFAEGKMGAYGSLGLAGVWFPSRLLQALFARRWGREMLQEMLQEAPEAEAAAEETWRRFLHAWPWWGEEPETLLVLLAAEEQGKSLLLPPAPPPLEGVAPEGWIGVLDRHYSLAEEGEPQGLPEAVTANLQRLSIDLEQSLRQEVRALLDGPMPGPVEAAERWLRRVQEQGERLQTFWKERWQEARRQVGHWSQEREKRRRALAQAIARQPTPMRILGRLWLGWGLGCAMLWATLEALVQRGWLLGPPTLVALFDAGGEVPQTLLLGLLWTLAFLVHGLLWTQAHRRPLTHCRDAYLEGLQNFLRFRLEERLSQAALLLLERFQSSLARSRETLGLFRQRLEKVAEELEAEEKALQEKGARLPFATAEWAVKPEEWEGLYQRWAAERAGPRQAAVERLGPVHQWGRYTSQELKEALVQGGLAWWEALWPEDVEAFLAQSLGPSQWLERVEGWYRAASPLLRFSTVHVRGEGETLSRAWLGMPNPASSLLKERVQGYHGQMEVVASGDAEWIRCLRLHSQLPLYALLPMLRYRQAYERRGFPHLQELPDPFPKGLLVQESPWHLWLVVGVGLGVVSWDEEGFTFLWESFPLRLGRDTPESLEYLRTHPEVAEGLYEAVQERIQRLGPEAVRQRLETFQREAPLSQASRESLQWFLAQLEEVA